MRQRMSMRMGTLLLGMLLSSQSVWAFCEDWSTQDTVLQGAATGLILYDWHQTRRTLGRSPKEDYRKEKNPFMEGRPSPERVNTVMGAELGLYWIAYCSAPRDARIALAILVIFGQVQSIKISGGF